MLPLRRLILRDLLVLMGLTASVVGLSLAWNLVVSVREQAEARAGVLVDQLRSDLNGEMVRVEHLGASLRALWQEGQASGPTPPDVLESRFHGLLASFPTVATVILVDAQGDGIFLSQADLDTPPASRTLNGFRLGAGGALLQIRDRGRALPPRERKPPLSYLVATERPWFKAAQATPTPRWVDPYAFFGTNLPGITYVLPIRGPLGEFQGAVAVDLLLEDLTGHFWETRPTAGSQVAMTDSEGRLILLPKTGPLAEAQARAQAFLQPLGPRFLPLLHEVGRRPAGASWFRSQGRSHLGFRRPLRPGGTPPWMVLLVVPEPELIGPAQHRLLVTLGLTLLCLGLVGLRARHLARRFGNPLRDLAGAAETLVQGRIPEPPATPISEIRTVGEALQRAGRLLADRTRLQQQLQHSQRLETLGTLAGGIAHDVNNQLSAILGQLYLARETMPGQSPAAQRIQRAEEAVERCAQTTRALLAFSHQGQTDLRPLDFNHLIRRTAGLLDRVLGGLVRVELDLDPDLPPILGEPLQLEQVLMNLAVNARDAMPQGGQLTFRSRSEGLDFVSLTISDTGRGIPPEVLPHIFEPFFTTKPVGKGTGLGLAMAFGILRAHGGSLDVASEPGEGATFTLRLPVSAEVREAASGPHPTEGGDAGPLAGLRILVAEDEPDLRETLADALTIARAQVETAPDGEVAWQMLQRVPYDLVLSDQRMPQCTGLDLLRRIRASGAKVPFILASGQDLEPFRPELEGDAATRLLPKPFSVAKLLELAQELGIASD